MLVWMDIPLLVVDGAVRRWLALGAVACVLVAGCGSSPATQADQAVTDSTSATPSSAVPSGSSPASSVSRSGPIVTSDSTTAPETSSKATSAAAASTAGTKAVPSPVVRARTAATSACSTWQRSETQDAPTASQTDRAAAATAAGGAALDPRWRTLASDMHFVAALPETGNPPSTVAAARADLRAIQQTCAALGVRITT
jgi:hypothetical protein